MASGEMSKSQFTTFLQTSFENLVAHSCDGSIHFICMDWRHIDEIITASDTVYSELKNLIVWVSMGAIAPTSGDIKGSIHSRRANLCELGPIYCDRIIQRWQAYAKDEAILIACGINGPTACSGVAA